MLCQAKSYCASHLARLIILDLATGLLCQNLAQNLYFWAAAAVKKFIYLGALKILNQTFFELNYDLTWLIWFKLHQLDLPASLLFGAKSLLSLVFIWNPESSVEITSMLSCFDGRLLFKSHDGWTREKLIRVQNCHCWKKMSTRNLVSKPQNRWPEGLTSSKPWVRRREK